MPYSGVVARGWGLGELNHPDKNRKMQNWEEARDDANLKLNLNVASIMKTVRGRQRR